MKSISRVTRFFVVASAFSFMAAPVFADTLPTRNPQGAVEDRTGATLKTDISIEAKTAEAPTEETPAIEASTEINTAEGSVDESSIEKLQAIRRNNIKQKIEALYSGEDASAPVIVEKKTNEETRIKGFFKKIIKLFE
jgi:hypothetical protein